MKVRTAFNVTVCLACVLLVGCSWAVDQAAGFPASHVIKDVKKTSVEIKEEEHQERVEEIDKEFAEYLRSRDTADDSQEEAEESVVIKENADLAN